MDYTKQLFDYFAESEEHMQLVVTPHAPPIERLLHSIEVAMETIWTEEDLSDTLIGLKAYSEKQALSAQLNNTSLQKSETFCLSIKGIGRFRVSYLTQRGSFAFTMQRIPFSIKQCSDLNIEPKVVERMLNALCNPGGGICAVFGPSADANSKLVYALLKHINKRERKIILILERDLTHLMRHDNSVVIQRELGSDCTTFDDGIREGLDLSPNIIFAGDLLLTDRLPSLVRAAETNSNIILSIVANDKESFLHILKSIFQDHYAIFGRRTHEIVKVSPLPNGGISAAMAVQTT
jgi:twitching motility protein PilT